MFRYHMSLILKSFFFDQTGCQYPANGRMVLLSRERFTAGLPYPGIFYVYALTVISGFNGVYLRYDF